MKSILLTTALLLALPVTASAQDKPDGKVLFRCQDVGNSSHEPLGDREGHAIEVNQYSCRVESGAWVGGVMTGTVIWEWDGPKATELSNSGVTHGPGGTVAYKGNGGEITLTTADGKVTGFTASGKGTNLLVTGSWGKGMPPNYHWTAKPDGPAGQFIIDSMNE